jgi:hypothetical protein
MCPDLPRDARHHEPTSQAHTIPEAMTPPTREPNGPSPDGVVTSGRAMAQYGAMTRPASMFGAAASPIAGTSGGDERDDGGEEGDDEGRPTWVFSLRVVRWVLSLDQRQSPTAMKLPHR